MTAAFAGSDVLPPQAACQHNPSCHLGGTSFKGEQRSKQLCQPLKRIKTTVSSDADRGGRGLCGSPSQIKRSHHQIFFFQISDRRMNCRPRQVSATSRISELLIASHRRFHFNPDTSATEGKQGKLGNCGCGASLIKSSTPVTPVCVTKARVDERNLSHSEKREISGSGYLSSKNWISSVIETENVFPNTFIFSCFPADTRR